MSRPIKRFNVCAARKYTTSQGEEKKQWVRVGEATDWDDGSRSMRLDTNPAGNWFDGRLYFFDADEQRGERQQRQGRNPNAGSSSSPMAPSRSPTPTDDFSDDDIPFD